MSTKKTPDGDALADLSPRARALLAQMNEARSVCRKLQEERSDLEERLMAAMARSAEAQIAYYTCLSMDESQAAEAKRRAASKA